MVRIGRTATTVCAAALLIGIAGSSEAVSTVLPASVAAAAAALQASADLGHGERVSRAASGPGGPAVPEGCRTFGHWVSSEARGTTCQDNPRRGGTGAEADPAPGRWEPPEGCRNRGHWVSSERRGTTCADDPRPGRQDDALPDE